MSEIRNGDPATNEKLTFVSPLALIGNAVTTRYGLEGVEPKEIVEHFERHAKLGRQRLCLAINGHFPDMRRGPYSNFAVQLLIQRAIRGVGLHAAATEEIYEGGTCPDELDGFLSEFEEFLLAKEGEIIGAIVPWSCSLADLSEFYEGNQLIDVYAQEAICTCIEIAVADACNCKNIAFTRVADVDWRPQHNLLMRLLSWRR